jgi:dolichyl-phosphate-mannose-protein mannosyltransferase
MSTRLRSALSRPELLVLTGLAVITRFWDLFDPRVVVWDEVHFETFAGAYFTGSYYVDVHPPLGKLLLAGAARLLGVPGALLAAHGPAPMLRILPALAGALIIPVVYTTLRELGTGRRVATLGAVLLLLDNALLVESRFILIDSMLILFGLAAIAFYVAARNRLGVRRWACLIVSATFAGMAGSVKWTGLSALGLVLLAWSVDSWKRRRMLSTILREGLALIVLPLAIYVGSFALHFALLKRTGPGDRWMTPQFQATLVGNPVYRPEARASFVPAFLHLNRVMRDINIGWATDSNPGASPWYTWPIAKHSIGFWATATESADSQRWIVLFGNPVVWWGALLGMAIAAGVAVWRRAEMQPLGAALAFLAVGYAMNLIPFAFIRRPMYLYHYFNALIFCVMIAAIGIGAVAGWLNDADVPPWKFPRRASRALYAGFIGLAAATFLYFAPMSYGRPLTASGVLHRRWLLERHFAQRGQPSR